MKKNTTNTTNTTKKGAALLIVILLIAILLNVAIIVSRSGVFNSVFNSNIINAMVAEQASQAGLEYGLLRYKNTPTWTTGCKQLNLDGPNVNLGNCGNRSANTRYAEIMISGTEGAKRIESIGYFNNIQKKHVLTQTTTSQ